MGFPLPDTEAPETSGFWTAAASEKLAIPRCAKCGRGNWYPAAACPGCGSTEMPWTETSGHGRLFSWTIVRHQLLAAYRPMLPYTTGIVTLEEDETVRIVTRIVEAEPELLRIGMAMRAVFRPLEIEGSPEGLLAPMFTPAL